MTRPPAETQPPPPPAPPVPAETPPTDAATEGMLDLDDHDQINNQHLEVR
jgi:hypothetical protein